MVDPQIKELLDARRASRFAEIEYGDLVIWPFLRPCRLRILMLVDASISYNHAYFGLSTVLDTLRDNPEFFVKFDVTRAHRGIDAFKPAQGTVAWNRYGPHFENFTFTQPGFGIDDYHEVWLFGFYGDGGPGSLTTAELEVLAPWMDAGGGVLAMGDHADLGAALCSRIPRVGTMRKWTATQGVPPPVTPVRHDTLLKGSDANYTFDDESDDQPMPIEPKFYDVWTFHPFRQRRRPHPLLCGTEGVIDILPDHPHEGEVIDEATIDVTASFTFGGYTAPEYPGGTPPEVVAWARVRGDHPAGDFKGVANAKRFGVIGAYDGHAAGIGRVSVDSTWHHWFDVNLTGRPIAYLDSAPHDATNPKVLGFLATATGEHALSRIQNYFRNVAMWLAPTSVQHCMFLRATWGVILRYPLVERLHPKLPLWELGGTALDAIGRRASQCLVHAWLVDIFPPQLVKLFEFPPEPDPCLSCPPFDLVELYTLGGATRRMLELAYELEAEGFGDEREVDERPVLDAFLAGLKEGARELGQDYGRSLKRGQELQRNLTKLLIKTPSRKQFTLPSESRD